ncbi:hypothetical protein SAMN06296058_0680 [Pseudoxanthomonas indica]|uniref:Uncharacterized protein n=1 Tax=Pseudoxanthomonas indica TaxID=428993 RepID=A0A1T5JC23_9GAMM|nr:hypothetical protein GCM10007235_32550 [Pseudoxanthomonas indica]SKC48753.1 hypothetical protein SAMN06296058_0680 [Pseudoxanthomonas indica]
MSRPILLVDIGAGELPAATPVTPPLGSWFPQPYAAPPPPTPTGLVNTPRVGGVRLAWNALALAIARYELERAPDAGGAPGTSQSVYTGTDRTFNSNESGPTWWRVRSIVRGSVSAWSSWVEGIPIYPNYNLLVNPTGANGYAGWDPGWVSGTQGTMSTALKDDGPAFVYTPSLSATDRGKGQHVIIAAGGGDYTLSAGMLSDVMLTGSHFIQMRFRDISDAEIDTSNRPTAYSVTSRTKVTRYSCTGTAPSNTYAIEVIIRNTGTGNPGEVVWEKLKLERGSTATPFTDDASVKQSVDASTSAAALASAAAADAASSLAQLGEIANDGKLTANEKTQAKREYNEITAEQSGIDALADGYGLATDKATYDSAMTALKTYLRTTVGVLDASFVWTNVTGTTDINRTVWNNTWTTLYNGRQALLNAISGKARALAAVMAAGANLVPNPTFVSNVIGTPLNSALATNASCSDNWTVWRGEPSYSQAYVILFPGAGVGVRCHVGNNPIANGQLVAPQFRTIQPIAVEAGQAYVLSPEWVLNFNGTLGGGITAKSRCFVQWLDSAGAQIGGLDVLERLRGAADPGPKRITAPAGARSCHVFGDTYVENTSGASYTHGASVILLTEFRSISLIRAYSLDTDLTDGAQYVRYATEDAYFTGGKYRNGLRFNASGHQVSGAYNFPPGGFANMGAIWLSGATLTYTATAGSPASATISCSAMTLRSMGSDKAYSASSGSVTGTNGSTVTYHLYYDDDTWAGGSRTLGITTDINVTQNSRSRLYIGSLKVTYPTSGSGGGGGLPNCVVETSFVSGGRRAGSLRAGVPLLLANASTFTERDGVVSAHQRALVNCVRLRMTNGVELDCSFTAPIPTVERGLVAASDVAGLRVATKRLRLWMRWCPVRLVERRHWAWIREHSAVASVEVLGMRWVSHITVENDCFWAGRSRHAFVLHHNIKMDPLS